ncbi:MYND finger containing protein, putative [Trypanosoma equiperdum]|uniref:MYND finger containing protein, putative n=1 Tax=Trypanosoma equiperdum TaxID=5694 RepID=A0A1G4IKE9_TRYEQ|nr:MYND finger containing protein, putative [Trypanosoma equiperdum]
MAVVEKFLRDGRACTEAEALGKVLNERYRRWFLLSVLPRQWCRDKRRNVLYAPVFQLLFGTSDNEEELDIFIDSTESSQWRLLLYNMKNSCQEVLWETKGAELVADIFRFVPASLHPASFDLRCVTVGDTHEKLGLFSDRAFSLFKTRLEHVLAPLALQSFTVLRHHITEVISGRRLPGMAGEVVAWAVQHEPAAVDVSAPSQVGNDAVLRSFQQVHPLLYTASFREPDNSDSIVSAAGAMTSDGTGADGSFPALEVERRMAIENLKKRVGHVTSFTLPTISSSDTSSAVTGDGRWHVLLIQKPFVEKQEVSEENLDPGPLAPQPIGAELHLMQDGGEVLYLQDRLCDEKSFDTVYDDMMHEDGEVFAQLTPLEGIAFDDIDRFLFFLSMQEQAVETFPCEPLCKGSCSSYSFPKVVYRTPTGSVVKDTPIASPHVEVLESSPRNEHDWAAAAAAFQFLSRNIISCKDGNYTLPRDVSPVPPPTHNEVCSWCQRRRDKLLRCGRCRVEMYCCRKHQMNGWKSGHREMCELWQRAREDYEQRVLPHLKERGVKLPQTTTASTVMTLFKFLTDNTSALQRKVNPIIHVVDADSDVQPFIAEFAPCVTAARSDWGPSHSEWPWKQLRILLCSDTFAEEEHNAVYAVTNDGNFVRTPPTTVLGDVWHTHSSGDVANSAVLLRFCSTKYHIFANDTMIRVRTTSGSTDESDITPSAVAYFGKSTGNGMTYFSGVAEILADRFVGHIPVLCTEATLVNAHNSVHAVFTRVKNSSVINRDIKNAVLRCHGDPSSLIQLNIDGMGGNAADPRASGAFAGPLPAREVAVARHPNSYYFVIPSVGGKK